MRVKRYLGYLIGYGIVSLLIQVILRFSFANRNLSITSEGYINNGNGERCHNQREPVSILFWNRIISNFHAEYTLLLKDGLPCRFISNQSLLGESQFVVFHIHGFSWWGNGTVEDSHVPTRLSQDQVWVFFSQESPASEWSIDPILLENFGTQFNATATYLLNADIDLRYGFFLPRQYPLDDAKLNRDCEYAANRTHLVAWLVSNCDDRRRDFVEQLRQFIPVDVFGNCDFGTKCPQEDDPMACLHFISQRYKFYLALENSDCHEYITEKFWRNALSYNMIPIVRGYRNNYKQLAPPQSYIDADHFMSIKELAEYLLRLNSNHVLYNHYLKWKKHYEIHWSPLFSHVDQDVAVLDEKLCRFAHQPRSQPKWYNIAEYFSKNKLCA